MPGVSSKRQGGSQSSHPGPAGAGVGRQEAACTTLVGMGFDADAAVEALSRTNGDIDRAASLLAGVETSLSDEAPEAEVTTRKKQKKKSKKSGGKGTGGGKGGATKAQHSEEDEIAKAIRQNELDQQAYAQQDAEEEEALRAVLEVSAKEEEERRRRLKCKEEDPPFVCDEPSKDFINVADESSIVWMGVVELLRKGNQSHAFLRPHDGYNVHNQSEASIGRDGVFVKEDLVLHHDLLDGDVVEAVVTPPDSGKRSYNVVDVLNVLRFQDENSPQCYGVFEARGKRGFLRPVPNKSGYEAWCGHGVVVPETFIKRYGLRMHDELGVTLTYPDQERTGPVIKSILNLVRHGKHDNTYNDNPSKNEDADGCAERVQAAEDETFSGIDNSRLSGMGLQDAKAQFVCMALLMLNGMPAENRVRTDYVSSGLRTVRRFVDELRHMVTSAGHYVCDSHDFEKIVLAGIFPERASILKFQEIAEKLSVVPSAWFNSYLEGHYADAGATSSSSSMVHAVLAMHQRPETLHKDSVDPFALLCGDMRLIPTVLADEICSRSGLVPASFFHAASAFQENRCDVALNLLKLFAAEWRHIQLLTQEAPLAPVATESAMWVSLKALRRWEGLSAWQAFLMEVRTATQRPFMEAEIPVDKTKADQPSEYEEGGTDIAEGLRCIHGLVGRPQEGRLCRIADVQHLLFISRQKAKAWRQVGTQAASIPWVYEEMVDDNKGFLGIEDICPLCSVATSNAYVDAPSRSAADMQTAGVGQENSLMASPQLPSISKAKKMKVTELKEALKSAKKIQTGNKAQLLDRLLDAIREQKL